jgi:hypothetical protein
MIDHSPFMQSALSAPWLRMWRGVVAALALLGGISRAAERKAILFLQQASPEREVMAQFLTAFQDTLAKQWPAPVHLRTEEIDANFPTDAKLRDWLKRKYERQVFDLIVSVEGPGSLMGISLRETLQPAVPVLVGGIDGERYREIARNPNLTGVTIDQDVRGLLEAAGRLCPKAKHLYFVPSGLKPSEDERKLWSQDAAAFAAAREMEFIDLTGPLKFSELLEQAGAMPRNSILLRRDSIVGGLRRPADRAATMKKLSEAANGPLFTITDAYADDASVGTGTVDYSRLGGEMAALAVAVFNAGNASSVPPVKSEAFTLSFDWRQLQRWGLDEKLLPPGSDLRFRQPGLWEQHRGTMIGVTTALLVQTGLIIALLLQRRWRKQAEAALLKQREQLSHTLRLATISQMASSLAHELNQPLTAIVNNAGTARRMIDGMKDVKQRARSAPT